MNMTDKDREEAREVIDTQGKKHFVLLSDSDLAMKVAEMCNDYTAESALSENELRIAIYRERIRAEAKAEALMGAADRADEAIVEWFDPFRLYDVEKDLGEVRHKVEYAIMHGDEPKSECAWHFDGDMWASECGLCWEFPERGPAENGVAYCPRCGKPVRDETKEGE